MRLTLKEITNSLLLEIKAGQAIFADVLAFIDAHCDFTATAFKNGDVENAAGQNSGSCRVFAFAQLEKLNEEDTLCLFAEHYQTVLNTPNGTDHQNIRQFMLHGWQRINFDGVALAHKSV